MNLQLSSLAVAGFRGVRRSLDLQFGEKLTIIYGGNATGKSSISQAIEFALTGQVLDHQGNSISARYLSNTSSSAVGSVTLRLTDGAGTMSLNANVGESRSAIEQRFRAIGSVDWPDRQVLPITVTHLTSQGTLAQVLADSVTKSDLSGLCTGAYLRSLVSRAKRLSDYFRQSANGRNMQSAIKDAHAAFEAARVLREGLAASQASDLDLSIDPAQMSQALAMELGFPDKADLFEVTSEIDRRIVDTGQQLIAIQRLLVRMRDLGQYEVELAQLRSLIDESVTAESALITKREEVMAILDRYSAAEIDATKRQEAALAVVSSHERFQQSATAISSLDGRLAHTSASRARLVQQLALLSEKLNAAVADQQAKSEKLVAAESALRLQEKQLEAVTAAAAAVSAVPDEDVLRSKAALVESERVAEIARNDELAAMSRLRDAVNEEMAAKRELEEVSDKEAKFLAAVEELTSLIDSDECTLCGRHHGSEEALHDAIAKIVSSKVASSKVQRERLDAASARRRECHNAHAAAQARLQSVEAVLGRARESTERLELERSAASARAQELLTRQGLQMQVSLEALETAKDRLSGAMGEKAQEVELARQADTDGRLYRSDVQRELAERQAEKDQLDRLHGEIREQLDIARSHQSEAVSPEALSSARSQLVNIDSTLASARHDKAKKAAELVEIDRLIANGDAQRAGAQRRLDVINGLLSGLDADLARVGATRDVSDLLSLEGTVRQRRDDAVAMKERAVAIQRVIGERERHRAYVQADEHLRITRANLDGLRRKHGHLNSRAAQFAKLHEDLEIAQGQTAESVLKNVREPVGLMFRAMTAGCQWDLDLALSQDGRVETRLLSGVGGLVPAPSLLNSAYLNVSAVALRIALASQQNWTSLHSVVLDDPILEMDSLTQSALIDGLEAVITSPHLPWRQLQFVITTWNEDFAILAAHKLAHLNDGLASPRDAFVIYRLGSRPDGTVLSERHTPRWKPHANAA